MQLAGYDDVDAAEALSRLLIDTEDTAPIEAAAQALLRRRDEFGADLIFAAISEGDDEAADHLLYFVARDASRLGCDAIWTFAALSAGSAETAVRAGARELLNNSGRA